MRNTAYWFDTTNQAMRLRRGMSDMLPRGSRISWSGIVIGSLACLGIGPCRQSELEALLRGQGFGIESLTWTYEGFFGNDYRITFIGTVPSAYANPEDAFSIIKGDVWDAYGEEPRSISSAVLNVPYSDPRTGQVVLSGAPAYGAPADTSPCAQKSGLEYLGCSLGLDKVGAQIGLGATAGVGIVLLIVVVGGIVILRR